LKKTTLILLFCLVFGSVGLQRAEAQLAPPPPPVVSSPGAVPSAGVASSPGATKVVRIYEGAGYFDDALAEKLRPALAKAFPSSKPDTAKAVSGAAAADPAKPEYQKKVAEAAHL